MRRILSLSILIALCKFGFAQTQLLNPQINYEVQSLEFYSNADGDGGLNFEDDIVIRVSTENYSGNYENLYPDNPCVYWQCDVPCNYGLNYRLTSGLSRPFDEQVHFYFRCWESENTDVCSYYDTDDLYFEGNIDINNGGYVTGQEMTSWISARAQNNGVWVVSGAGIPALYDMRMRIAWRYASGDDINNPLNFGQIVPATPYAVRCSNLPQPEGVLSNTPIGWNNDAEGPSPDVYFQFSVNTKQTVILSTDNIQRTFDTRMFLYNDAGTQIGYNDDTNSQILDGHGSQINALLGPGTYYVMVEGYDNEAGIFQLDVSAAQVGDKPCAAVNIPADNQWYTGFGNEGAGIEANESAITPPLNSCTNAWCDTDNGITRSVWFKFTAPASGKVEINTCEQTNFDNQMAVYKVGDCNNFNTYTLIQANDDGNGCADYQSKMTLNNLTPNQEYYMLIDGYSDKTGLIGIRITPINTSAVQAPLLSGDGFDIAPNPTTGILNIEIKGDQRVNGYSLYDLSGKIVLSETGKAMPAAATVDLSALPKGVYMFKLIAEEGMVTRKIVLQ